MTWACEKFQEYVTGLQFTIETDHKPLVPIFMSKHLSDITPRLQRLKMRMMRFSYKMTHVPGKDLVAADALSRQPLPHRDSTELEEEVACYVRSVIANLPSTDKRLAEIRREQAADPICSKLSSYCNDGWPDRKELPFECKDYWQHRSDIAVQDGLLMKGSRIIIPGPMRKEILAKIHQGHQGIVKCRARARESVWWPGVSTEIEELVRRCTQCVKEQGYRHEPLMPSDFPDRPWQKVAMDMFHCGGKNYLLVTDYYSRYPEIALLPSMTAQEVIKHVKSIFARHGTPETVFSDNGPQFKKLDGSAFRQFAEEWGFEHVTSSPRFPQSNGFVEAAVRIIKKSLQKTGDSYVALQAYRATPLANGFSPAELLMGRRLRTSVPAVSSSLDPAVVDNTALRAWELRRAAQQKRNHDRRHGARILRDLEPGETVWIKNQNKTGTVLSSAGSPRSYIVETDTDQLRRNRIHLAPVPEVEVPDSSNESTPGRNPPASQDARRREVGEAPVYDDQKPPETNEPQESSSAPQGYKTRSGRVVKPVQRL